MPELERTISSWYEHEMGWHNPQVSIRRHFASFFHRALKKRPVYLVVAEDTASKTREESFLKVRESEELARKEFDTLKDLHQYFEGSDPRYGVPSPRALLHDPPSLLISRAPGRRLDKIIWGFGKYNSDAYELDSIRKAASWLVVFHKKTSHPDSPHRLHLDALECRLQAALNQSCQCGLDGHTVKSIRNWLSNNEDKFKAAKKTMEPSFCVPTQYGGYEPDHIFISDEKTSCIDFEQESCGWPADDLANFLADLDLKWTFFQANASSESLRQAFLQDYISKTEFTLASHLSLEISYILNLLDTFLEAPSRATPEDSVGAKVFTHWVSWLARKALARRTATGTLEPILR